MRVLGGARSSMCAHRPDPDREGAAVDYEQDYGGGGGGGGMDSTSKPSSVSQRATSVPDPPAAGSGNSNGANKKKRSTHLSKQVSYSTLSALLEPFTGTDNTRRGEGHGKEREAPPGQGPIPIPIPASSRAGADIAEQKTANQIGLLESWKYLPFLAHQATSLASAFVSHHVFGPPKKSWGIELTLFTTAVRESVQFSHLSSLGGLRKLLNLQQILPVPRDGVVTPVTFRVRRRNLPGVLREADEQEDGTREITGEWVVSKRIWRRMQQEHHQHQSQRSSSVSRGAQGQLPSHHTQTHTHRDKVILYLHGGAYYTMSAATHRYITISVSKYTDCRVFAVNYRLAPECRWPGQIHDAVSAYLRLVHDLKIPPENIIFAGDSAGGGLCAATMLYLRDAGMPLPCGAILMSPWVDLTMSCDSWETNAPYDYLRMPSGDDHMNPIASYLGADRVKSLLTHPYVSPLFGDFAGLPPLLIQCGDAECLRDEGTLLAHKASLAGVQVFHEVYEDCPHVFQALFFLEAAKKAFRSHRHFVKRVLPSALGGKRSAALDVTNIDEEVLADGHAVREDGEAEARALPASPPLSSVTSSSAAAQDTDLDTSMGTVTSDNTSERDESDPSGDEVGSDHIGALQDSALMGGTGQQGRQQTREEQLHPAAQSGAASALRAVSGMINLVSKASPAQHHDLERVDEEQDESIAAAAAADDADGESEVDPASASLARRREAQRRRTPPASAPSSPSTFKTRHRSLSSLTLTPTPGTPVATSPAASFSALYPSRPGHSRQGSASSIATAYTAKPGMFRQNSRPRARANSHPDLQALLDSYEKSPASAHSVLLSSSTGEEALGDAHGKGGQGDQDMEESPDSAYGF